ncbi:hypothetical protein G6F50_017484 [Rhizopus delemar]|uniref:Uncharacterized protein n=1 Tax=Rhizopus delemar TaxID=936053 RepID=A0A9P6XQA3_9FUNG|nr:hypothetical protein G6F50_017484 [Rhizopus delemar]
MGRTAPEAVAQDDAGFAAHDVSPVGQEQRSCPGSARRIKKIIYNGARLRMPAGAAIAHLARWATMGARPSEPPPHLAQAVVLRRRDTRSS